MLRNPEKIAALKEAEGTFVIVVYTTVGALIMRHLKIFILSMQRNIKNCTGKITT